MVPVARYLNVTLIVPELEKTSFWADPRLAFDAYNLLSHSIQHSISTKKQKETKTVVVQC